MVKKNCSKIFFSETSGPIDCLKTWYAVKEFWLILYCSNDASGLTLTYFMLWTNLVTYAFVWQIVKSFATEPFEANLHWRPIWE